MRRMLLCSVAVLAVTTALIPGTASAHGSKATASWASTRGATTLEVDPGTLSALGGLGVAPGAVAPATLEGATYSFPITSSLFSTLRTGIVRHSGGISLTAGATTVLLTEFEINLVRRQLFGKVNGAGPVALLDLDYGRLGPSFRGGRLAVGPVGTTLTQGAAEALNGAFGVTAFTDQTVLGTATINYQLFPF